MNKHWAMKTIFIIMMILCVMNIIIITVEGDDTLQMYNTPLWYHIIPILINVLFIYALWQMWKGQKQGWYNFLGVQATLIILTGIFIDVSLVPLSIICGLFNIGLVYIGLMVGGSKRMWNQLT